MKLKSSSRYFARYGVALVIVVGVAVGGAYYLLSSKADTPAVVTPAATDSCTVSPELVNSCRPWIGANVYGYPEAASDEVSQSNYQAAKIGHPYDIVHTYHQVGSNQLSATDVAIAQTPNQMLFTDWNPVDQWGDIATQNAGIDQMAASIKALGTHKIFMTLWHEPENNVSPNGDPNCTTTDYVTTDYNGTVAQYRNMWIYVHNRFAADGVTNVVWSLDFINYSRWDCLIPDLYPGDQYVDWIWFNNYDDSGPSWSAHLAHFYDLLTADNNPSIGHSFLTKPWGVVEWSVGHGTEAQQESYIAQATTSLDTNEFPRIKGYMVWDSNETGFNDRVGYDSLDNSQPDPTKEAAYINYAKDPRFTDAFYQHGTPPDTTPPTVTLTSPTNGTTVTGNFTVTGNASDNVGVTAVTIRVDNAYVETVNKAPYSFSLTNLAVGTHTIQLRAFDAANNMGQSSTITVNVVSKLPDTTPPTISLNSPSNGAKETGAFTVTGTASDNVGVTAVTLRLDNVYLATDTTPPYSFALNASSLSPGTHTIVLRAFDAANNMGQSSTITITVPTPSKSGGGLPVPIDINGTPTIVITAGSKDSARPVKVSGKVTIQAPNPNEAATIALDGKAISGDVVDTSDLTNGMHTIKVTQAGVTSVQKIKVANPLPTAVKNSIEANTVAYSTGGGLSLLVLVFAIFYLRKNMTQFAYNFRNRKHPTFDTTDHNDTSAGTTPPPAGPQTPIIG